MAITITMAFNGWIGVWAATALCLGQNIGTTITAYLASLGTSTNAKRSAMAHILFNVIGTVLSLIFFRPLIHIVNFVTVGDIFSMQGEALNAALPTFLAGFHTLFNLLNAVVFFPFITPFSKLVEKIVPVRETYDDNTYHFKYIASSRIDTPELYLLTVKEEMIKMMDLTENMFKEYEDIFASDSRGEIQESVTKLKSQEDYADQMQEQLIDFCVKMQQDSQTPTNASILNSMIRSIDEIESITDSIFNLAKITEDRSNKDITFTEEEKADVVAYHDLTSKFLSFIRLNIGNTSFKAMQEAASLENSMNESHKFLSDKAHAAIQKGTDNVKAELMLLEIERNLEHIGDYLLNIAEASFSETKHSPTLQKVN